MMTPTLTEIYTLQQVIVSRIEQIEAAQDQLPSTLMMSLANSLQPLVELLTLMGEVRQHQQQSLNQLDRGLQSLVEHLEIQQLPFETLTELSQTLQQHDQHWQALLPSLPQQVERMQNELNSLTTALETYLMRLSEIINSKSSPDTASNLERRLDDLLKGLQTVELALAQQTQQLQQFNQHLQTLTQQSLTLP